MHIIYLFTTYPLFSETFLQREQCALRKLNIQRKLFSLWGGLSSFKDEKIYLFKKAWLLLLPFYLIYWVGRKPVIILNLLIHLFKNNPPSLENIGETIVGIAFALIYSLNFEKNKKNIWGLHGVWATMPSTAAYLISNFINKPYSMGAHAYDLFLGGGDWLLKLKCTHSKFIHTSTLSAKKELILKGINNNKIKLIRRGIDFIPPLRTKLFLKKKIRILSVGRLVEKKDYFFQLDVYKSLLQYKYSFEVTIIGTGPLEKVLNEQIRIKGLSKYVRIITGLNYEQIKAYYQESDLFIFSGKITKSGDRDGLPNVIPEAMSYGIPVIASKVGGITEILKTNYNGIVIDKKSVYCWIMAILKIFGNEQLYFSLRKNAYKWVLTEFNAFKNTNRLTDLFINNYK